MPGHRLLRQDRARLFRLEGGAPAEVNHGRLQETDPDLVTEAEDTCPTRAILVVR